jgi:hypothetical protein
VGVQRSCWIANQNNGPFLGLKINNVLFDTSAKTASGVPMIKWTMRFHGRTQFEVVDCKQTDRIVEHFLYADNVQGDSLISRCEATECGRTMIQIVNRIDSGVTGFGTIIMDECTAIRPGVTEGASAFTVAGHLGHVEIVGCKTIDAKGGSVVSWWEGPNAAKGKLGAYLNADGMAINSLVVRGCDFSAPGADRPVMQLSASSDTKVGACNFQSNKDGIGLDHQQGKPNKAFSFMNPSPSQWQWAVPRKVTKGWDKNAMQVLTDAEIDALYQE